MEIELRIVISKVYFLSPWPAATPSCPIMSLWPWKSADMNFDQLEGPKPTILVGQHDSTCPLICMNKMMLSQHNYKTTIKAQEIKRYNYHLTIHSTLPQHLYSWRKNCVNCKMLQGSWRNVCWTILQTCTMMCFSIRKQVLKWTIFCVKTSFQIIIVLPLISSMAHYTGKPRKNQEDQIWRYLQ